MNTQEIKAALAALAEVSSNLEEAYIDNGGEITEVTVGLEGRKAALENLLEGEGIDALGRWLKSKQDEEAALKAEMAYLERRIKACHGTVDFIKDMAGQILRATGRTEARGSLGYKFTATTSTTRKVNTAELDEMYLEMATEAARNAGLPGCIDVALVTNVGRLEEWSAQNEGELGGMVEVTVSPACTFRKPVEPKKKEVE